MTRLRGGLTWLSLVAVCGSCSMSVPQVAPASPDGEAHTSPRSGYVAGAFDEPSRSGRLRDRRITEASGLVASRSSPGAMWTHNDSGDDPVIYCIRAMGRPCGAWRLTGASAFDWEDIAWGPGPGTGYLYVGDIGDNLRVRSEIVIYRVPEPEVSDVAGPGLFETAPSEALRFTYPGAPRDAESAPSGPVPGLASIRAGPFSERRSPTTRPVWQ